MIIYIVITLLFWESRITVFMNHHELWVTSASNLTMSDWFTTNSMIFVSASWSFYRITAYILFVAFFRWNGSCFEICFIFVCKIKRFVIVDNREIANWTGNCCSFSCTYFIKSYSSFLFTTLDKNLKKSQDFLFNCMAPSIYCDCLIGCSAIFLPFY